MNRGTFNKKIIDQEYKRGNDVSKNFYSINERYGEDGLDD